MSRLVRAMLVSLLVLALDVALPGPASAAPTLDQEQPTIDTSSGFVFGIGGGSEQKLAQVFTPGLTGNLTQVDLSLACEGDLTIQIQGASDGKPNGVILGTFITPASGPFPTTFRSFVLASPVALQFAREGHPADGMASGLCDAFKTGAMRLHGRPGDGSTTGNRSKPSLSASSARTPARSRSRAHTR